MPNASRFDRLRAGLTGLRPNALHLSWGLGSLGTITMVSAVSNLYLFFLVGVVQISPATAGLLIFLSKLVDMISDPLMGWISDKTNTRWGRRRPYMFFAAFGCALSLILLFSTPLDLTALPVEAFVLCSLIIYALALTAFNVPYLAMPAEMTTDYHERSSIMSYRAVFLVGGGFVGSSMAGPIIKAYGGGREGYEVLGYVLAAIVFASMMISVLGTRKARFTTFVRPTIARLNQLKLFLLNTPFLILAATKAFQFLQLSAGGATTLFFFVSILDKDEALLLPFGLSVIAGSVLSLRFWLPVIKRFGKRETFMLALVVQAGLFLTWLLATPSEPLVILCARAFLLGAMGGGILIAGQSMIMDTIEYDRRLSGINREGLYSATFSFVEKSMHATGPLIVGLLLAWFGYDTDVPRGQPQPQSAQTAILVGQAWLPAACSLIMMGLLLFYRLTEDDLENTTTHELGQASPAQPAMEETAT